MSRSTTLLRLIATGVALGCVLSGSGRAADPQPYTVNLASTGDGPLDAALKDSASLIALRERAPVAPFALITRARDDKARLEAALGSFGYYNGTATIRVAGRALDDAGLPDALEQARGPVAVTIAVERGPVFHLRRVGVDGPLDPATRAIVDRALQLQPGAVAHAADVVAAQGRMLDALRSAGHALAKVDAPVATLEPGAQALDVRFHVDPGPAVRLGPIAIAGLDRMHEEFVRRRLLIHQDEAFDPAKIEAARQDLAQLGVFATVQARAADGLDGHGELPITINVVERPRHVVGATAAYSTDLGASAGVTWSHRNLFGNAEKLDLGAAVTQVGGTASRGEGYNVTAALTKPDVFVRNQSVTVSLQGIKENLDAYDRTAFLAGVQATRRLDDRWTVTAGLLGQQSRIAQEGVTRDYTLLGLPLGGRYDSTGPAGLFEPTQGIKASVTVTPTASLQGGTEFVILQASGSTYVDVPALLGRTAGRSIVALRATVASIEGATAFRVPPDQRLYAGGSGTVRGYKYQSVGPRFTDNRPQGGASLAAATVEFRQRFGESFGAVVFADAGQVGQGSTPGGALRAGAGAGARYYTPIGPIRLDVAVPLQKRHGDDALELYIGIGQVF